MEPVPFFVFPLAPELQARTSEAHVIRGLSYWLSQNDVRKHPFDLVYLLRLRDRVDLWKANKRDWKMNTAAQQSLLDFVGRSWYGSFPDLMQSMHVIFSAIGAVPHGRESFAITKLIYYWDHIYYLPSMAERYDKMAQDDVKNLPADVMARFDSCMASLEQALLAKDPMMPQHLRNSHALLISYPEAVHLLNDSQIATIIAAAQDMTKTEIIGKIAAGKGGGGRRASQMTINDL